MTVSANHRKSGPGRKHQHCLLRLDHDTKKYFKLPPKRRLIPSVGVINWQGREVLSYGEHDKRVRERLEAL